MTIVERNPGIETDNAPRAAMCHPTTLELIGEIGVIDEFVSAGLVCRYLDFWDKTTETLVARMHHDSLRDGTPFPYVVRAGQHKLVRIALDRSHQLSDVDIRLGWAVDSIDQGADRVTATVRRDDERETLSGDWLFGRDGGRGTVRKALGIEFDGRTWPDRFAVLTTPCDFGAELGRRVFPTGDVVHVDRRQQAAAGGTDPAVRRARPDGLTEIRDDKQPNGGHRAEPSLLDAADRARETLTEETPCESPYRT